jgi:hypothetical protein
LGDLFFLGSLFFILLLIFLPIILGSNRRLQEDIATLKTGSLDNWLDAERKTTMIAWEKVQAEAPRKQVKLEEEGGHTIKKEKEEEEPEEENKRKKAKSSSPRPSRSRSRRGTSPNAPGSPPFSPSSISSTGISSPSPLSLSSSSASSTSPSTSSLTALSSPTGGFTSPAGSVVTRRQSPRGPLKGAAPSTPSSSLPAGTTPLTSSTEDVGAGGRKRKRPSSISAPFSPPVMTRGEREKERELRSSASVGSEESSSSSSVSSDTPKDKKELLRLLRTITGHKNASIFKEPVNLEEAPDYEQVIKKRMDLSTLKKKIETGVSSLSLPLILLLVPFTYSPSSLFFPSLLFSFSS